MALDGVIDVRDVLALQRRILGLSLRDLFNDLPGAQTLVARADTVQHRLEQLAQRLTTGWISSAHAAVPNGKLYYVHTDHLGTPQALTDEGGAVVWSAIYDPFGQATVDPASTVEMNVRFPGQYYDGETGLHYNYFRTYDPGTGRYLESDPIGLDGGLNTYAYVGGNPLRNADPRGLDFPGCDRIPDCMETPCRRKACDVHDDCYARNNCTEESWTSDQGGEACDKCNSQALSDWGQCGANDLVPNGNCTGPLCNPPVTTQFYFPLGKSRK